MCRRPLKNKHSKTAFRLIARKSFLFINADIISKTEPEANRLNAEGRKHESEPCPHVHSVAGRGVSQNRLSVPRPLVWTGPGSCSNINSSLCLCCSDRSLHFSPTHFSSNATTLLKVRAEDRTGSSHDLTSAAGTPSGGRQCRTIIPLIGTSLPWGSCSKFFLRSAGGDK